mmetsp:Transcript_37212/g.93332  ORF Transcript_37212/g.93332 Transcript_37212/m.93332 type:complete len:375 (-) Transcript_37212:100-1224(-)
MRFLVAWDGSDLSTLALQATIHIFSRRDDQLIVYHVSNRGRYGATDEFGVEVLQERLASELKSAAGKLRVLSQRCRGGFFEEVSSASPSAEPASPSAEEAWEGGAKPPALLTIHEKEASEAAKISERIIDFAIESGADALVMGSVGAKQDASATYQQTGLGSSARLAALRAPCSVLLIRPGCKMDSRLKTVFMVAVDGSHHALHALRLCSDLARPDKDEIVCRVCGPPEFTEPVEEKCKGLLQEVMKQKKVEYSVIQQHLEEDADEEGAELAEAARDCRFKQQAFLVFGARGRHAEGVWPGSPNCSPEPSPKRGDNKDSEDGGDEDDVQDIARNKSTCLGHVARWCIREAQCSLIIARPSRPPPPGQLSHATTC